MKLDNFSQYEIYPNEGKIWSYRSQKWIGAKDKKGYLQCNLYSDDGKIWHTKVHRVVWTAVNGEIPTDMQVNHLDENKDNNCIDNLNLMTCKENCNWGTRNERVAKSLKQNPKVIEGLKGNTNGKANKNNPKRSKQVGMFKDGVLIMTFPSTAEAQRNGYVQSAVASCCRGLRQSHKGFQWQYLN